MCEKVKLDKRTADAIEHFRGEGKTNKDILGISTSFNADGSLNDHIHVLALTDFDDLARALYIGYEVEPKFKVGDWVHNNLNGCVFQIKEDQLEVINDDPRNIRHATKQEAWWASHGRGVWELKGHDILTHSFYGGNYAVFSVRNDLVVFYRPNEDRMLGDVRENFKVKYFAEDRKDA